MSSNPDIVNYVGTELYDLTENRQRPHAAAGVAPSAEGHGSGWTT
jgi:hypothetical protein